MFRGMADDPPMPDQCTESSSWTMRRTKAPHYPDDIVIHTERSGEYVIATVEGDLIGTCDSRRDAMRRACTVADQTGATVWVCIDESLELYSEVVCP
jgi:hypothetical protein